MTFKTHHTQTAARLALVACAALCVSGVASGAYAADPTDDIHMREVSLAGLNLARQADVERLYRRIAGAARWGCEPVSPPPMLEAKLRVKRCVAEAIARAVADVNAPALTRYYAMKTHQAEATVALSKAH